MKNETPNRDLLNELGHEDAVVFENPDYDSAIIGIDSDDHVIYDFEKMVEHLMENDKMSYEEAVEFIEYNTIRALPYFPGHPYVMYPLYIYDSVMDVEDKKPYTFDANAEKDNIVQWIREWFDENGKGCNAVLGLSGGKDSTICAALLAEALGPDRVIGVAMPDRGQGLNGAQEIASHLGIRFLQMHIGNIVGEFYGKLGNGQALSNQAQQNIPPRVRMTMLYAIAQTFNGRVCCCDNASENYIGYSTFGGDDLGAFSPIGNMTVTEVRKIGKVLGLPEYWVEKTPDDGLPNSMPDEEKFGFSYETLDKYIREGIEPDEEVKNKIDEMHEKSEFKRNIIRVPSYNKN